jgi:hypothetical protein
MLIVDVSAIKLPGEAKQIIYLPNVDNRLTRVSGIAHQSNFYALIDIH